MTDQASEARPREAVRFVTVTAEDAGQRIDNFLARQFKGVPKSRLYRALRRGEVRVNKGRVAQTYRLTEADTVRLPPLRRALRRSDPAAAFDWPSRILLEDRHLLVIDKPSGFAVHGGSGIAHGVIESLRDNLDNRYLELVHRLDRSTSGCLVVAKRRSVLRALHEQLRAGRVLKRYLTLVAGDWQLGQREVDLPLDVEHRHGGERTVRVAADGRRAITRFALRQSYGSASLLEANPLTGRTHQIRVHAAHCGHPILGDRRYGEPAANRRAAGVGLSRLFLHAASIEFEYPEGNPRVFSAPLSDDLRRVIDRLERCRRSGFQAAIRR